jgi:hypothetical protein
MLAWLFRLIFSWSRERVRPHRRCRPGGAKRSVEVTGYNRRRGRH